MCDYIIDNLNLAFPLGTTGNSIGFTINPLSNNNLAVILVNPSFPNITGTIGVGKPYT